MWAAAAGLMLATPLFSRLDDVSADLRMALRYHVNRRLLPLVGAGLTPWERAGGGRRDLIADDLCLIGIDGPTLAELGKFGSGDWVVREPFRRMVSVLQKAFRPSVVAYDILFRPTMGAGDRRDAQTAGPDQIEQVVAALQRLKDPERAFVENEVLLTMTRLAAIQ